MIFLPRKQRIVAQSSAEAEFVAANHVVRELKWLLAFLKE